MIDRSLVNPYVKRIHDLPEYILARGQECTDEDRNTLLRRANEYPSLIIELGSGSGGHILKRATQTPSALFVGFELRFKRVFRTAQKASQYGIHNVMLLKTKAEQSLEIFPENFLDGIYCNFPDPWEKKHWQKHRMLRSEILIPLLNRLKPGGFFAFKTDHRNYFHSVSTDLATNSGMKIDFKTDDLYKSPALSENIETEFECLFRSQGLPIFYIRASRD